ncbi:MAG: acyl-CoA synthetase FdrA [archaeon]|nr:acyl-CoA synthetase FdrA [archaeon]
MASLKFVVVKDTYRNSVELMTVSEDTKKIAGVADASVMMATDANLELLVNAGFIPAADPMLQSVSPADLLICIKIEPQQDSTKIADEVQKFVLSNKPKAKKAGGPEEDPAVSIREGFARASEVSAEANKLVLVSVPGEFATAEALKALKNDASVFLFSNNVELEDENFLKEFAVAHNKLVMGPDCGTAMLDGISFGFVNQCKSGRFGIVGASGTGTQEVMVLIDRMGEGLSHAIGVGGRDLDVHVGGKMMISGIRALENDKGTEVIVLVSKPPAPEVAAKVLAVAATCSKPVIVNFLGADASSFPNHQAPHLYFAHSMEEAAVMALAVGQKLQPREVFSRYLAGPDANGSAWEKASKKLSACQTKVRGLYCGGTLAKEALLFLKHAGHSTSVIDLGDDQYTRGKPHPMIEPLVRNHHIVEAVRDSSTAVILSDVVLGFGSHADPAGLFVEAVAEARKVAQEAGRDIQFVVHVCGTDLDYQTKAAQEEKLRAAGVHLCDTNVRAARLALSIANRKLMPVDAPSDIQHVTAFPKPEGTSAGQIYPLRNEYNLVNAGLLSFTKPLTRVQHLDWQPPAQSNRIAGLCAALLTGEEAIEKANAQAVSQILATRAVLKDISIAKDEIKAMANGRKLILHAGPPISWKNMSGPMKGAVIGACLYEGWADNKAEATRLCESGAVEFSPAHHCSAVGPMAGIISPSMPMVVVADSKTGRQTYCNLNEGLGKVLRFGANSEEVINRLRWMGKVLQPTLRKAVHSLSAPIDLTNVTAQALQMGDECHNRNAAATGIFTRLLAPALSAVGGTEAQESLNFLGANDHFFLNFSMPTCKLMLDNGHGVPYSSVVTAMARNGYQFGIRMSGTGDEWFTAPAPFVKGLLFPGFTQDDACPDMGDSAITETCGIGGFAMAASPAIVRFVGGDVSSANAQTARMRRITLTSNNMYTMPSVDFAGTPTAIDARLVVDSGVAPVINTGIAHKEAGVGQIGAGIVHAPLVIFRDAVVSLSRQIAASPLQSHSITFLRKLLKALPK